MRIRLLLLACWILSLPVVAEEANVYQLPPNEILQLANATPVPRANFDRTGDNIVLLYSDKYKSIAELSAKELKLGGLRIDPNANIESRTRLQKDIKIKRVGTGKVDDVKGLPALPKLANFRWSPDHRYMAMTHKVANGVELWLVNIAKAEAKKLTEATLNANLGDAFDWFGDGQSLLVKMLPSDRKALIDTQQVVPRGPTISTSNGKKARNYTYQDLLKNANDEFNFEQIARSRLVQVSLDGKQQPWLDTAMYAYINFSPNGEFVLVGKYQKPFSYLVQYDRFPGSVDVYDKQGKFISNIVSIPLIEDLPKGFMAVREGRRNIRWRSDLPDTLVFVEALDGGDPANRVAYRDELKQLSAPFNGKPLSLMKMKNRLRQVIWGDAQHAIVFDYWWNNRNSKTYLFDPSQPNKQPVILYDRNYQDNYSAPGGFVTRSNKFNRSVLALDGNNVFLVGKGHSEQGQFPFLDKLNLESGNTERLYQSKFTDKFESLHDFDVDKQRLTVRIESKSEYPNYYFRDLRSNKLSQVTNFESPFKAIESVQKEVIEYKRADGLPLSGTLYLPTDHQPGKRYPMILWAYPREYKDKASAAQNTQNPNAFTYLSAGSPVYWVTRGYVVLNNATFPILGENEEQPNDTFRSQLVANAKAAIDALDARGLIDPNRVAVGGHSYGAFMVANLLTHTDLFAAGIAKSGAYNRTLTPFGFQAEPRSLWEAPELYNDMAPFMHADKMKTPLLLIHGQADNNSGTYPMQSERYFNALKGLGAPARLVLLPKESHSYAAKESVMHILWEQDNWLEKHVKNRKVTP